MNRADVITRLRSLEPRLRAHGVVSLYICGSYARDEASSGSDIDVLADFAQGLVPNLSRFMIPTTSWKTRSPAPRSGSAPATAWCRSTGRTSRAPLFAFFDGLSQAPRLRLQHMLENIDGVLDITAGLQIETIVERFVLIRATEPAVQIISEAAKELAPAIREQEPGVL